MRAADRRNEGRSGILIPPGDAPALARALAMLAVDSGKRAALGAQARSASARYSHTRQCEAVEELLLNIV